MIFAFLFGKIRGIPQENDPVLDFTFPRLLDALKEINPDRITEFNSSETEITQFTPSESFIPFHKSSFNTSRNDL
jgi:hypothetical protein